VLLSLRLLRLLRLLLRLLRLLRWRLRRRPRLRLR
jgi:hypothetical protein